MWIDILVAREYLVTLLGERRRDEAGLSVVEWVIGITIVAGLVLAVGAIIVAKVTDKANEISLN
ncbi:hypothetical protein [Nocardioides limicola]|uniref:hypothetical protein n=1 Tax=Nocardioides limicola TaxID=2803368 RepID=UPI00193B3D12|nr:hypothetical protein [Nocardioides sp. DJM-14]